MNIRYFLFLIINAIITYYIILRKEISLGSLFIFWILMFYFFFKNAYYIKKTRSSIISFFLYLIFCICICIYVVLLLPDYESIAPAEMEREATYPIFEFFLLIVGAIAFISSYAIVLIQIIRDFSIEIRKRFIKKK